MRLIVAGPVLDPRLGGCAPDEIGDVARRAAEDLAAIVDLPERTLDDVDKDGFPYGVTITPPEDEGSRLAQGERPGEIVRPRGRGDCACPCRW
ncbi:MAG TPA: hypothetical protein VGB53_04470 [Rubricoccaceae bacterium]|jgi:hypothetical protein